MSVNDGPRTLIRLLGVLSLASLLLAPRTLFSDAPWIGDEPVSDEMSVGASKPSIAVGPDGSAYAVWQDRRDGGNWTIYSSHRDAGAQWGSNVRVVDLQVLEVAMHAVVDVDAVGNAYAVWQDYRNHPDGQPGLWSYEADVYFSYRPVGGTWSANERVNDVTGSAGESGQGRPIAFAVDQAGNALVVWHDVRNDPDGTCDDLSCVVDLFFDYRPAGGTWSTDAIVNDVAGTARNGGEVDIAVDDAGQAYVLWRDKRPPYLYFTQSLATGGWAPSEPAKSGGTAGGQGCAITTNQHGDVWAIWSGDPSDIYAAYRPAGGPWGPYAKVNDGPSGVAWPDIAIDSAGNVQAVWTDMRDSPDPPTYYDIFAAYRPAGRSWQPNVRVTDATDRTPANVLPAVDLDIWGNTYVVWTDDRNDRSYVYFAFRPADADGDGLPDRWEEEGVDVNGDGTVDLDLPAMGADRLRKDIFVEVDYMIDQGICLPGIGCQFGHSHQPKPDAMARVVEAFSNAPVENPDGSSGISLHVDYGRDAVMNPLTGELWGSLSEANSLPHDDALGSKNPDGSYNWSEFEATKAENFSRLRASVFHYVIFAHNLGGFGSMSGISRNEASSDAAFRRGASDFIVSLGSWSGQVGTVSQQAGTFMHELGHNLGLRHGGDDHANFEPNFLSIMNYAFQTRGLMINGQEGHFDYSRFDLDDLDENSLDETIGLSGSDEANGYGTRYWCSMDDDQVVGSVDAVDWNCDGDTEDTGIQENVNEGPSGAHDTSFDVLESYNDWANLVFSGGAIGRQGAGVTALSSGPELVELTQEQDAEITGLYGVAVAGSGNIAVLPESTVPISFTLANAGLNTDTYTLTVKSTQGWADLGSVPPSMTLAPGQAIDFVVTVDVPAGAAFHAEELSLSAASQANPLVEDLAIAVISAVGRLYLPLGLRSG
jgi:hypothetical protein